MTDGRWNRFVVWLAHEDRWWQLFWLAMVTSLLVTGALSFCGVIE